MDFIIILAIGLITYRFIRKTEAVKVAVGVLLIYFFALIAVKLHLTMTGKVLTEAVRTLIFGLVIIFQQEIRQVLKRFGELLRFKVREGKNSLQEIEEAVFTLSEQKTGALIVLDHEKILSNQLEILTPIDAYCSSSLLQTIFQRQAPLHDGAVIIAGGRILFAGCKLPIAGKKRTDLTNLGTRHLAAIENAEKYRIPIVVVSEETGTISIASQSGLIHITHRKEFRDFFEKNAF